MSLEQRVLQLEQEVKQLRAQMAALEQRPQRKPLLPARESMPKEEEERVFAPPVVEQKPRRSLEQVLASWLPKIFMVILVLGVVWGLKVMSDYGLFGDMMKIASAYMLSLAMLSVALRKKDVWTTAAIDALFGGAFIVGIVTTAAGAILYDVLSQLTALIIALVYIVYGVAISYVRRNEVLTSFVFFTSLLLPYLLDYMNMSKPVIFMYIVVLFAVMQLVIVKYTQWIALMIGFIVSTWTLTFFLWEGDAKVSWALLIVLLIMAAVSAYMLQTNVPHRIVRIWLFITYFGSLWMFAMEDQLIPTIVIAVMLAATTGWLLRQGSEQGADVFYALAVTSVVIVCLISTSSDNVLLFVLPILLVSATCWAWYKQWKLSAIVLSSATALISIVTYMTFSNESNSAVHHVQYVLLLLYGLICYVYAHRKRSVYERAQPKISIEVKDILSAILLALFVGYSMVIDQVFSFGHLPYVAYAMLTALLLVLFVMPKAWLACSTLYSVTAVWLLFSLNFLSGTWELAHATIHVWTQVSVLIVLAILLWMVMRQNEWAAISRSVRLIGIVAYMYTMYVAFVNQLFMMDVVSTSVRMMLHTLMLFGVAGTYMAFHQRYKEAIFMRLGIALLAIALLKLLVVDLVAINIFIRAILFMLVGAIGFYLSTRFVKKHSES